MPQGYTKTLKQYGLPHEMKSSFELSMEDTTKRSTVIPIAITDKSMTAVEDNVTNPFHVDFVGKQDHPFLYPDSSIGKTRIGMTLSIPVSGQETGIQAVRGMMFTIAMSFDDVDLHDADDGTTLASILKCDNSYSANYVSPDYNATDITTRDLWSGASAQTSLTTNSRTEGVNIDWDTILTHLRGRSMSKKMKTIITDVTEFTVFKDRPIKVPRLYYNVPGKCQRANENMFYGLGFYCFQAGDDEQFYDADETTAVNHLRVGYDIYYKEYHDGFSRA